MGEFEIEHLKNDCDQCQHRVRKLTRAKGKENHPARSSIETLGMKLN